MTPSPSAAKPWGRWLRSPVLWAVVVVLVSRLALAGWNSPWLDEINNWQTAKESGLWPPGYRAHVLTYWFQAAGLMVSDSAFGLRLSAVLFGGLALVLFVAYAGERLGRRAGWLALVVVGLSPFMTFFSRDANHYAPMMLAGFLATFSADWLLNRPRPRWGCYALAAGFVFISPAFHPLAVVPLFGLVAGFSLWFCGWSRWRGNRRLVGGYVLVLLAGAGLALFSPPAGRMLERLTGAPIGDGPQFGLSADFLLPLARNLTVDFAGFLVWPGIRVFGLFFLFLCFVGTILILNRLVLSAANIAAIILAFILLFALFEPKSFFYPKFCSVIFLPLMMGLVVAADLLSSRRTAFGALAVAWLVPTFSWQVAALRGDYQPTRAFIQTLVSDTEPDAILAVRYDYGSRATGFLLDRMDLGSRTFIPLSSIERSGGAAVQQMREIAWRTGKPLYFSSLQQTRDLAASDFLEFLASHGEKWREFPSPAQDDLVPLDRTPVIWKIRPPRENPFLLPRDGSRPSSLANERTVVASSRLGSSRLEFPINSGAVYSVELAPEAPRISFSGEWLGTGRRPDWLVLEIAGRVAAVRAADLDSSFTISLPGPFAGGVELIAFFLSDEGGADRPDAARLLVTRLDDGGPGLELVPLRKIGEAGNPTLWNVESRSVVRWLEELRLNLGNLPGGRPVLAVQWLGVSGLPDQVAHIVLRSERGHVARLSTGMSWTFYPVMTAAVFMAPEAGETVSRHTGHYWRFSTMPRPPKPTISVPPIRLYTPDGD